MRAKCGNLNSKDAVCSSLHCPLQQPLQPRARKSERSQEGRKERGKEERGTALGLAKRRLIEAAAAAERRRGGEGRAVAAG